MRHKKRVIIGRWLGILLLAVLCIGGMELAVCRVMDPDLYASITDPVKATMGRVLDKAEREIEMTKSRIWERVQVQESPVLQARAGPDAWKGEGVTEGRDLTKFDYSGERELLLGGNRDVIYYNQEDPAWRNLPYGSDNIGAYGCGPAVMAMAVSSMTQQAVDPAQMSHWSKQNGHWARGHGSYLSIVQAAGGAYGLRVSPVRELTAERLRKELATGKQLIALMTKGHFTSGGHFILLRGVTLSGGILVADPSSRERSLMVWDPQIILDELSGSRTNGAPLWAISSAQSLEG